MTLEQVKQLKSGDEVFWTDPDNGLCSKIYIISTINVRDDEIVSITDKDGSVLECLCSELV